MERTNRTIQDIVKKRAKAQATRDASIDRMESMRLTARELRHNVEATAKLFAIITEKVLEVRYRDVCPEIRRDCLVEIKYWMRESLVWNGGPDVCA